MRFIGYCFVGLAETVKHVVIPKAISYRNSNKEITVNGVKTTPKEYVQYVLNA